MKREWKPGDVALVEAGCHTNRRVALRTGIPTNMGWAYSDTHNGCSTRCWSADSSGIVTPIRPLVVIDPEDREQVERFREIASRWSDQVPYSDMREAGDMDHTDALQAALREFADPKPPKRTAALSIKGEHFACDLDADHDGLAHSNRDAEVVWSGVR